MVSVPGYASGGCRADRAAAAVPVSVSGPGPAGCDRVRPRWGLLPPDGARGSLTARGTGLPYPTGVRVSVTVTVTVTVGRGAPASPGAGGPGVLARVGSGALQSPRT